MMTILIPRRTDLSLPPIPDSLTGLIERAKLADGQPPFSDGALGKLRSGENTLLQLPGGGAVYSTSEAEFVVEPEQRSRGIGGRLLEMLLERCSPELAIWAHGDHPAARALASHHGFEPVRTLLQLRMLVPAPNVAETVAESVVASASDPSRPRGGQSTLAADHFRPGIDDSDWLRLNAQAFASHPEQGAVSQTDLSALAGEPWFDAEDFLLLRSASATIIGYCWLKVVGTVGEFYVVGVDPGRQGEGIGRRLMAAGFARLRARGIRTAALYVEADNRPAVALYRSLGFTDHSVDIRYTRPGAG